MTLPKISYPTYTIKVPSTKKNVKFRPFLVKEEKLLLMAKESENNADILQSIKQIVNNCCLDENFDNEKLTIFDLEYIFIKLRAFSVDNIVKVSYKDEEDGQNYDFEVDLNSVEIDFPEKRQDMRVGQEFPDLKTILNKIINKEDFKSKYINESILQYIINYIVIFGTRDIEHLPPYLHDTATICNELYQHLVKVGLTNAGSR